MKFSNKIAAALLLLAPVISWGNEAEPSLQKGAEVFKARCSLCHGSYGMGDGQMALAISDYPATNLLEAKYPTDSDSVRQQIVWGGSKGGMHAYSPPWGHELTWTDIESLVLFIEKLRAEPEATVAMLKQGQKSDEASLKAGRLIFQGRCALCHGSEGEGNGKMARIIKSPPPFNLTLSRAPDAYLQAIISQGGEKMGRSPRMPPWGTDLSDSEIDSVIMYIKTLRRY
jgi:mono/diheme cytochrome c family protein